MEILMLVSLGLILGQSLYALNFKYQMWKTLKLDYSDFIYKSCTLQDGRKVNYIDIGELSLAQATRIVEQVKKQNEDRV